MPHPNERKIIMQIQTIRDKCSPTDAFKKGLEDLQEMCEHIKSQFQVSSRFYDQKINFIIKVSTNLFLSSLNR